MNAWMLMVLMASQDQEARARRRERDEDIRVFARVLEKRFGARLPGSHEPPVVGVVGQVHSIQGGAKATGTYLKEYGAVIDVGLPLAPDSKPRDAADPKKAESLWEAARKEVQGKKDEEGYDKAAVWTAAVKAMTHTYYRWPSIERGEAVQIARGGIGEFGMNIRHLRDADWLVVRLVDRSSRSRESGVEPVLIRVKVADVRAYAKGELRKEEFDRKIEVGEED